MIAALQMYDWPEVRGRTDVFWSRVRENLFSAGVEAPVALSRPTNIHTPWPDASLILGQTCGLPYVSGLAGDAVVIGRPCYGLPNASTGYYRSALICRRDAPKALKDFQGRRAAINDLISQSGCNALAAEILGIGHPKGQPFFSTIEMTGSHRASAICVAEGKADIAAIDAVAWQLFEELEPARYADLRVVAWTAKSPALPFITSRRHADQAGAILAALKNASGQTSGTETGVPKATLSATDMDYQPIRDMAALTKGMRLAPNAPPLG